jgi:hypothetical protein
MENWNTADRISDRIVDMLKEEIGQMRQDGELQPLQILAGQVLALLSTLQSAPPVMPPSLVALEESATTFLKEMLSRKVLSQ